MTQARHIRISGLVQGVGFRPFVWRLARELDLAGWVRNDAAGVEIAAEGAPERLDTLLRRLENEAPPSARVDRVSVEAIPALGGSAFVIAESGAGRVATAIGHDTGLCPDCLEELFDPAGRRWRHAFITCTHCGPRYTLSWRLPYDRANTSLAPFALCPDCAGEYADPADRRFHAETTCCPACGPQLRFLAGDGTPLPGDPVALALEHLRAGRIVALKGLGGFHLACDARDAGAVARLRQRKAREEKPFAVMAANTASLASCARCDRAAADLLRSPQRPIVLVPKGAAELPGVAPGLAWIGAMLPATPIQWLLFHEAAGRPAGTGWLAAPQDLLLVMTSANPGGEPLVVDNDEALARLAGIADGYLLHDRAIVARCDDSVVRATGDAVPAASPATPGTDEIGGQGASGGRFQFIRRARGYTPTPIPLADDGPDVLALGAGLKNTVCFTRGREAFLSAHVGDLDNAATVAFLEETVHHLRHVLQVAPRAVACDLHPDFPSTRLAQSLAEQWGVPLVPVQHHQAHIAAIAAEHGVHGPLAGLALDGVGLGSDGGAWGGELLRIDGAGFDRLGHLAPLPLPGGDRAAREPWRMAAAALHRLGRADEIPHRFPGQPLAGQLAAVLDKGLNTLSTPITPPTSSLGRVFDAAAALLGIRAVASFEGQAAMLLEGAAARHGAAAPLWTDAWRLDGGVLDLLPLLGHLADWADWTAADGNIDAAAAGFHRTLAAALAAWAEDLLPAGAPLALGGGCVLNVLLLGHLQDEFAARGRSLLRARAAPPNDGGIALGQAWVARRHLPKEN